MQNPWKVATLGLLALAAIAGTSTLTTAYLLRPPLSQPESTPPTPAAAPEPRAAIVRIAPVSRRVVAPRATPVATRPAATAPAAAPSTMAPDCDTGGERAARIAKPGALGALLGAGLGAVGGGIAKGGKGAGQGALIGGLAGAAIGAGYGAYKTKTECGTVFGDAPATRATSPESSAAKAAGAMAPFEAAPTPVDRIHIFEAR